ncbi:MAG: hypothetical protein WBV82_25150 [Myxococcaceae bacterium]
MERKAGTATVAVTREEVRSAFARTRTLSSEEEKALRMRHGIGAERAEPLPRAAGRNAELEDELLVIEMQLMRAWRARLDQQKAAAFPRTTTTTTTSRTKDKIVRALRKKK